jgi:hypothetical protein
MVGHEKEPGDFDRGRACRGGWHSVVAEGGLHVRIEGAPVTSNPDGSFRVEAKAALSIVLAMTPPTPTMKRGVALEPGKTTDIGSLAITGGPPEPP